MKWKELQDKKPANEHYSGALKRLEHEVGFLCVDTYSLYEGIIKKKSLYSKVIKNWGRLLSKIDKTPIDRNQISFLGTINSEGEVQAPSPEEEHDQYKIFNKGAIKSRETLENYSGITSHKHEDLDEWKNKIIDDGILVQLERYRNEFAHRLNSLENLKRELKAKQPHEIEEILNTIEKALRNCLESIQPILRYTKSTFFNGVSGFEYNSLSRLELAERCIDERTRKEKIGEHNK